MRKRVEQLRRRADDGRVEPRQEGQMGNLSVKIGPRALTQKNSFLLRSKAGMLLKTHEAASHKMASSGLIHENKRLIDKCDKLLKMQ
jgi:hypothetical protein